jgi:chitin disaccharide deacetylase
MVTKNFWSWFRRRPRPEPRELIVNADDFGMSASVNRGIVTTISRGIVTSASLMVRRDAAREAAAYARRNPNVSVGLHVDLGEWIRHDGEWQPLYAVVDLEDGAAVRAEIRRQLHAFRDLIGADPTHLDSHQHVHRADPVRSEMLEVAREFDVPLRHFTSVVRYCGEFYGQERDGVDDHAAISAPRLVSLFNRLTPGVTELCCHPGAERQSGEQYGAARPLEMATLCDPRVKAAVDRCSITLRSFRGLRASLSTAETRVFA